MEHKFYGEPRYQRAVQKLCSNESKTNIEQIWMFLERECTHKGLTNSRKIKYTWIIKKTLDVCRDLTNIDTSRVEGFFHNLKNNESWSPDTKEYYWVMFRIFAGFLNPEIDFKQYKIQVKKRKKLPEDILTEDEICAINSV